MKAKQKIAVIGGGGRTGQYVVNQLIESGFHIKVLLRNPDSFNIFSPLIEIVKGDVLDADIVDSLIVECDAVISTVGQRKDEPLVASVATLNVLAAIEKHQNACQPIHYIVLAGLNVDTPFDKKGPETQKATDWMKATFPEIHADRQKSYAILHESPLNWTLVRVPFIDFSDEKNEIKVDLADCLGSRISAGDIARFMIAQLAEASYFRQAPFISN